MIKTCPNCGGLFCTPPDATFSGRACNCGYAETVNLSIADAVQQIKLLQTETQQLREQLEQEKKWKEEDPRMLREQIRVADVAFNHLQERFNKSQSELSAWITGAESVESLKAQVQQLRATCAEQREALTKYNKAVAQVLIAGAWNEKNHDQFIESQQFGAAVLERKDAGQQLLSDAKQIAEALRYASNLIDGNTPRSQFRITILDDANTLAKQRGWVK